MISNFSRVDWWTLDNLHSIESKRQHLKSLGHEAFDSHVASKVFWTKVEKYKSDHNSIASVLKISTSSLILTQFQTYDINIL